MFLITLNRFKPRRKFPWGTIQPADTVRWEIDPQWISTPPLSDNQKRQTTDLQPRYANPWRPDF